MLDKDTRDSIDESRQDARAIAQGREQPILSTVGWAQKYLWHTTALLEEVARLEREHEALIVQNGRLSEFTARNNKTFQGLHKALGEYIQDGEVLIGGIERMQTRICSLEKHVATLARERDEARELLRIQQEAHREQIRQCDAARADLKNERAKSQPAASPHRARARELAAMTAFAVMRVLTPHSFAVADMDALHAMLETTFAAVLAEASRTYLSDAVFVLEDAKEQPHA